MVYKFKCPACGKQVEIQMRMAEYKGTGHMCECGTELIRDINDIGRNYQVKCDGFYSDHQSN